jgi:hypothetical protein
MKSGLTVVLPTNGAPVWIDLFTRSIRTSGQLEMRAWKEPKHLDTGRNDWGFRIAIPTGGLIEHDDELPFTAPETSYQQAYEWRFTNHGRNWQARLTKRFYVRFGNPPRYGRIELNTTAFHPNATLEYVINPAGTRNLEAAQDSPPEPGTIFD